MYFTFKPATQSHRDLIHYWLQQEHISAWIHGTGLQNTFYSLEQWLQNSDSYKEKDRTLAITQHWIGFDGLKPFVYLLISNVNKNKDSIYAKYSKPKGYAITLDIFIGDTDYLGKGLAAEVIHEFLLSQFLDVDEVFINPEKTNTRAIHVYQKARFTIKDEFIASWHPVPHYLMQLNIKDLSQFTATILHADIREAHPENRKNP